MNIVDHFGNKLAWNDWLNVVLINADGNCESRRAFLRLDRSMPIGPYPSRTCQRVAELVHEIAINDGFFAIGLKQTVQRAIDELRPLRKFQEPLRLLLKPIF
jgi:hypothetical protein